MNILILTSEYPYAGDQNPDRTRIVGDFAKKWGEQGHQVVVIVNSSSFPSIYYSVGKKFTTILARKYQVSRMPSRLWRKAFSFCENGVTVCNLPMKKYIPHGAFSKYVMRKQLKRIQKKLSEFEFCPEIITGHWVNPQLMLVSALGRYYNAKTAFVFHADYLRENCEKYNVQRFISQVDHIGFRSQSAAAHARGYLSFKVSPFVAASGIPDTYIAKQENTSEKEFHKDCLHILTAGRLVEYKKIDSIILAAAEAFPGCNFCLTVAGDGVERYYLEKLAGSLLVSNRVHLMGHITRDALQEEMRSSDVFALISQRETFGLVYLEAMLQGCIVIASRFGGADGIIENGRNGFLCEEGNVSELAGILRTIDDMTEAERRRISCAAVETALQYSESSAAERYLKNIME